MARKKPRATPAQIEAARKRITGYLAKSEDSLKKAAGETYQVTQKRLKEFMFQPPKETAKRSGRNQAYKRILEITGKKGPIGSVKRVPIVRLERTHDDKTGEIKERIHIGGRVEYVGGSREIGSAKKKYIASKTVSATGRRRGAIFYRAMLQETETEEASMAIAWQQYTTNQNIPPQLNAIRAMYEEGLYTRRQTLNILTHWRELYGISDDYFEQILDQWDLNSNYDY